MSKCLCIRPPKKCKGRTCLTVDRWAEAVRVAHWNEDNALRPWKDFVRESEDGSEPELWRQVARVAIARLGDDPSPDALALAHDLGVHRAKQSNQATEERGARRERARIRLAQAPTLALMHAGGQQPSTVAELRAATRSPKRRK